MQEKESEPPSAEAEAEAEAEAVCTQQIDNLLIGYTIRAPEAPTPPAAPKGLAAVADEAAAEGCGALDTVTVVSVTRLLDENDGKRVDRHYDDEDVPETSTSTAKARAETAGDNDHDDDGDDDARQRGGRS